VAPKVGILIATYSRPVELGETLESLRSISTPISHIVVCDASPREIGLQVEEICNSFQGEPRVQYLRSSIGSSCVQRNIAAEWLLSQGVEFIQVLDDDTQPAPDYISRLLDILQRKPNAIGASGVTSPWSEDNSKAAKAYKFIYWLFGLEGYKAGQVSRAGCGIPANRHTGEIQQTQWLFGCSLWKAEIFQKQTYLPQLPGAALFEDTEFSVRAAKIGSLFVDPNAELRHGYSPNQRPNHVLYSYRFSRNRWFVVSAMPRPIVSKSWYWVSVAFLTLLQSLLALKTVGTSGRQEAWQVARSTLLGSLDALKNKQPL
jgi:GT2 family glycosyltransferase